MSETRTPLTLLKLTDGRLVPYDKERVAAGILAASQAVGHADPLWPTEVAEAVSVYLRHRTKSGILTEKELEDAIVKTLLRTGHIEMAKAYVLYRSQRRLEKDQRRVNVQAKGGERQITVTTGPADGKGALLQLEIPEVGPGDNRNGADLLLRDPSGELIEWNRAGHLKTLTNSTGLAPSIAEHVVDEIAEALIEAELIPAPVELLLYLQAVKLIELDAGDRELMELAALPIQLLGALLVRGAGGRSGPRGAEERTGQALMGYYVMTNRYPRVITHAHYSGELQVHRPWSLNRFSLLRTGDAVEAEALRDAVDSLVDESRGLVFHDGLPRALFIPAGEDPRRFSTDAAELPLWIELRRRVDPPDLVGSRVSVNLQRIAVSGEFKAPQLAVEAVKHAVKVARVKRKFLRRLANRHSGGLLQTLVERLGRRLVNDCAGNLEVELHGLETAVFRLSGSWPQRDPAAAELQRTIAAKIVGGAARLARERNIELRLRAVAEPRLDAFFATLDRAVLGLEPVEEAPPLQLEGAPGEFSGPWAPAYPEAIDVELRRSADSTDQGRAVEAARAAGAGRLVIEPPTRERG